MLSGVCWLFYVQKFVQHSDIVNCTGLCYLIYTIFGYILKYTLFRVLYSTVLWQIATDFQMLRLMTEERKR